MGIKSSEFTSDDGEKLEVPVGEILESKTKVNPDEDLDYKIDFEEPKKKPKEVKKPNPVQRSIDKNKGKVKKRKGLLGKLQQKGAEIVEKAIASDTMETDVTLGEAIESLAGLGKTPEEISDLLGVEQDLVDYALEEM